ncbi:MAG: hypothetical protein GY868_21405 [Deltaproteobacteria bacterium]|nr:hypothetical protein [Deltaproteobacteria bacterium]
MTITIENAIATLTFNRPDVLNALSTEVVTEALDAAAQLEDDDRVRVIIATGAGRSFIAGADIAEMLKKNTAQARTYSELGHRLMNSFQQMPKPVIAAINGFCLGGGMEVALACDIRLASERARFGLPETILGIIPGWGATQRSARLIGTALTKELIFTGEHITAQRALEMGLVNRVIAHEGLMPVAMSMAHSMCRQGSIALAHAKQAINRGVDQTLAEGCTTEINAFVECFETEDRREGMQAFLEKRTPKFTGK